MGDVITYALIDGDIIIYQAGFASDQRQYVITDLDDAHKVVAAFPYKKDADAFVAAHPAKSLSIEKKIESEPLEYCLNSVNKMLESIRDTVKADKVRVFLTPSSVFRHEVDSEYKGNRDASHKPTWHKEIKEHLITHWNAEIVEGIEADDCIGIVANLLDSGSESEYRPVMCSLDKDLLTIPGEHYNWRQGVTKLVTADEALLNFWKQMLMGDSADNIKGIPKIGKVKSERMLRGLSEKDMERIVINEYQREYGPDWRVHFEKNYTLLYILRDVEAIQDEAAKKALKEAA